MVKGIDRLIICSPYEKPAKYYEYDSEQNRYYKKSGRRPSGYQSMNDNGVYGIHRKIDSVDKIRKLVDKWRSDNYPDTTKTTKTLLNHWRYRDENRLFFCQIEAIETIIYASEHQETINKILKDDGGPFRRYCTKMATGTGKTLVMGMLIAWQVLNTGTEYTKNILVVTPNLTVKDRLEEIQPNNPDNIYNKFNLLPSKSMRNMLGSANITITNFQQLKPKRESPRSVAKLGTQGAKSFATSIVGRNVSKLLVINDEGHHAWRPSRYGGANEKDAGVWMAGLDLIHKACTIIRCHDFSATPFVPTGKSSTDDTLFEWIISDFSLSDAIESGLVKTPRTPETGDRFYHLYQREDVSSQLSRHGATTLPELVVEAYKLLGGEWKKTQQDWKKPTPPVMITVCNNTRHAKLVMKQFQNNRLGLNEGLTRAESLLHIDSEAIKAIESDDGRKEIRNKVSTVGKAGESGEKICNIVSVDMLTEGWDARTVTHIMGLRAFKSQLLCEQVVGRGLRRTSYDLNDEGLFDSEYVHILGVPFAGILSEEDDPTPTSREIISRDIFTDKPKHMIAWPAVVDIRETVTFHTNIDWKRIKPPEFDITHTPFVAIGPHVGGWVAAPDTTITFEDRKQTLVYTILQSIMSNYRQLKIESIGEYSPYNNNQQQTAIEVLDIVKQYVKRFIDTARLDELGRAVLLFNYREDIAQCIFQNLVLPDPSSKPVAVIDGTDSTDIPRKSTTKKRWFVTKKTHLNLMTADSDLELAIGRVLDADAHVLSWTKSDMVGFLVSYAHPDGTERGYMPDFIAQLSTGIQLIIEGKGKEDDVDKNKKKAIQKWVNAVNLDGRYGVWDSCTIYGDRDIRMVLSDIVSSTADREYVRVCEKCALATKTLAESVNAFGLEKVHGILSVGQLCRKCQKTVKITKRVKN